MWSYVLAAVAMSANVHITFDNATEAAEMGYPLAFKGRFQRGKIYKCTMDGDGLITGAWQAGLVLDYNSDEFN